MTDEEIRAIAIKAASRLAQQNFQGGGYSYGPDAIVRYAQTFAKYIKEGK